MASFFFYSKISLYGILFFHKSIKLLLTCNVTGQKRLKWKSTIITFSLTWVSCVFFRWFFRRAKTIAMNFAKSGTIIEVSLNPLLPNISMQILQTVLHTFPKRLTRRICLTIKSCFSWWSSPLFSWLSCLIQGWYGKEKLDASHS